LAVSRSKKFLAVCEKSQKAICTVYDINSQKQKRILPDPDEGTDAYVSQEFLSVCFQPKSEGSQLITLSGQPDWMLLLWDWKNAKVITKINIGITGVPAYISQKTDA
jgi:WD40 repeat protein